MLRHAPLTTTLSEHCVMGGLANGTQEHIAPVTVAADAVPRSVYQTVSHVSLPQTDDKLFKPFEQY